MNQIPAKLGLEKSKDKTFVRLRKAMAVQEGKVERGVDFLWYHFSPGQLSLSKVSVQKLGERILVRLYEARESLVNTCGNEGGVVNRNQIDSHCTFNAG